MREWIMAFALAAASQSACAMSAQTAQSECRVVGGEKLPSATGGSDALCAAVEQAVADAVPGTSFTAELRVHSRSMLSGKIRTADGREIPEQRHAVMDGTLTRSSFDRFAKALASRLTQLTEK